MSIQSLCRGAWAAALLALALELSGCASGPKYTVDDGRPVNPVLLAQIRHYGDAERAVRPAIARSAQLADPACDKQWELPFSVASSESWAKDDRVAWVRALGVDERLTVIAAAPQSPLQPGQHIERVLSDSGSAEDLLAALAERRDKGKPFGVTLSGGQQALVQPFQVCRGYTRFSPPNTPKLQDYHWLMSLHPAEVVQARPTDDEALWMVLWTQGLSEEAGVRMKAYHYTTSVAGALYNVFTLATGLQGVALAAKDAQQAAASVASDVLKQQLIDQAKSYAADRMRESLSDSAQKMLQTQVLGSMQRAAANRGALLGISRVAATAFDRADAWAFDRMARLGASPVAGFALHQKLAELGLAENVFVFDSERLAALSERAERQGLRESVVAALRGLKPEELDQELEGMPLASAPGAFSYEDTPATAAGNPYAYGLVEALVSMPGAGKEK